VMLDSPEDDPHPYVYSHVLQIFHANVALRGEDFRPMEFIWVRWYRRDARYRAGWKHKRLHRVEFVPHDEPGAFGFLDPADVVRGVHLIPQFRYGRTDAALPRSMARSFDDAEDDMDWRWYNVNWFVDRDMVMRYHDDAIGH
ncbi:hypothetical protein GGX14DRAFT_303465, partial [Mycena pura]